MSGVDVVNFGCRLNIAEGEAIRAAATAAGAERIIIFNSCAVTDEAARQVRQAVRRAARARPDAAIIVTGCAAELEPERFDAMGVRVVANDAKGLVESYLRYGHKDGASTSSARTENRDGAFPEPFALSLSKPVLSACKAVEGGRPASLPYTPALSGADHARAFLGVQTGCSHSCTFCATVLARGKARSADIAAVLDSARTAIARGQQEIILTGVDLGSYGDDGDGGLTLAALVEALLALPGLKRLRLSSLDPDRIDDALFALLTQEARVMPHVHLSLQAGDDMILKRMKRRHSRAMSVRMVERLKAARSAIAIGADLIAGFPTEDAAMFANSRTLIDDCDILFGHIFPYSPRAGTPAARMPQIERSVARARAAELRSASMTRRQRWLDTLIGTRQAMLVERDGVSGHGENFAAMVLAQPAVPGAILPVRVTARADDRLLVEPVA